MCKQEKMFPRKIIQKYDINKTLIYKALGEKLYCCNVSDINNKPKEIFCIKQGKH